MKKIFFLAAAALTLLSACTKAPVAVETADEETSMVEVVLSIPDDMTKASFDSDGRGALVNHWVVEVRDCSHPDMIFYRAEKDAEAGVHKQTFELMLVRNQTYDIAFWADTKGCYDVSNLTSATVLSQVGNADKFDAFCCCKSSYLCTGHASISAVLLRPLSQVNFISTDLKLLEEHVNPEAYVLYEPTDFEFTLSSASSYNVFAGAVDQKSIAERTVKASKIYGCFSPAEDRTTIYMTYVFADAKELKDVNLKFISNQKGFNLDVTNVPMKENYRTNIIGGYFAGNVKFNITVNPDWYKPEINVEY